MSFAASYTPNIVRLAADDRDLEELLDVIRASWGKDDVAYAAVRHAYENRAVWIEECDGETAELYAALFYQHGLTRYARPTWAAVKRCRADALLEEAAVLEAEAAELEGMVAA